MPQIISKTFGRLSATYYIRQLMFGLLFPLAIHFLTNHNTYPLHGSTLLILAVNTLLYPCSRFVHKGIADDIVGDNVFYVNAPTVLAAEGMTMVLCWTFAIFIAPAGLAYLYFQHSRSGGGAP